MSKPGRELPRILASLHAKRRIVLIGQVVVDIVCSVPNLPTRSGDVHVDRTSMDIGGSAPNIAVALNRLGLAGDNLFPVGLGDWSELIFARLAAHGIETHLIKGDSPNGWTMALVEPDGERTFVSTTGISSGWTREELERLGPIGDAIVYLCGYEMTGPSAGTLLGWIEEQADATLVYDPGPRIQVTRGDVIERLCRRRALFTVNRQEIAHMVPGLAPLEGAKRLAQRSRAPVIVRLDKDGAACVWPDGRTCDVAGFAVDVVDTIGAGDSHTAGVIAALACGLDLRDGLILGNALAAMVVSKPGSMLPPGPLDFGRYLDA
jgi:sugar/nucleoside kinase (ribokinase family)